MDFRHLIVTCLFSKLRLPFDNQKVKENYAIFYLKFLEFFENTSIFLICRWHVLIYIDCFKKITVRNDCQAIDFIKFAFAVYLKQKGL